MPRSHSTSSSVVIRSMLKKPLSRKKATCSSVRSTGKSVVGFMLALPSPQITCSAPVAALGPSSCSPSGSAAPPSAGSGISISWAQASDSLIEFPQRHPIAVVLQDALGLPECKPAKPPVLVRYNNAGPGCVNAESVFGNDVNMITPEIAILEASHGNRRDRVEGQEHGVGRNTGFFERFSLGGLQGRFLMFAAARNPLPAVVVRPTKHCKLIIAVIDGPVGKNEHLKGRSCHSLVPVRLASRKQAGPASAICCPLARGPLTLPDRGNKPPWLRSRRWRRVSSPAVHTASAAPACRPGGQRGHGQPPPQRPRSAPRRCRHHRSR